MNVISNVDLYLQLLAAAEQAAACQMLEQEEAIIEEMDEVWKELSAQERAEVDLRLGMEVPYRSD